MGGRLTVSSRVSCGSTFTFILPYKVSPTTDHSDDPDELSEMTDHDAVNDDSTEGLFRFEPRTLGSLFSSNGSICRSKKLLQRNIGFTGSHKLNAFPKDSYSFPSNKVRSSEKALAEDACSKVELAETLSESESSFCRSQSPDSRSSERSKRCRDDSDEKCQNHTVESINNSQENAKVGTVFKESECQRSLQSQETSETSSNYTSISYSEVTKLNLKPKILLVEDNKINVMVTQSMMKQLGHTIDVVNNGVEAVRAVQSRSYDLVLMVISRIQKSHILAVSFH